ncbi:MAG: hypothetical protein CL663_07150 [Bacteroidetes bacterium]|nr:hypothetical protein [Bacteroidota bacterium]|tara:strand:+ start:26 stop:331 length:306 start_codon:yes stop_codon:yes gene_type:complete
MKIVAIILSIYVLALTAMPCNDSHRDDFNFDNIEFTELDHDQFDNIDTCTPFCYCNCCQSLSLLLLYNYGSFNNPKAEKELPYITQIEILLPEFYWRPPQI